MTIRHPLRQVSALAAGQALTGAVFTVVARIVFGPDQAVSFALGALIALLNLLGLTWAWWRLLTEKRVAWTVLIIVIKYAVLLSSTYYLARAAWFDRVALGLGVASFIWPALALAVFFQERESSGGSSF